MLRVSGRPPSGSELRIYGLENHSPQRDYRKNQTVLLTVIRGRELSSQAIRIPQTSGSDLLEVMAVLTSSDGSSIGAPARLSLSSTRSVQASPPALQRLMNGASAFLDRLLSLYDSVRTAPEDPRALFVATLEGGKSPSVNALALDRAQYHSLALSSDGDRIAWTVERPEGYELWTSRVNPLEPVRLAASGGAISTPAFADKNTLLYVAGFELMLAALNTNFSPHPLRLPFRSVARIHRADRDGPTITTVVRAQHPDNGGIELPYLIRISNDEKEIVTVPLADNSFYEFYSQFVEGAPFFYAGSVEGVEGIYALQSNDSGGGPIQIYKIRSPGLVALSGNGKKLAFAGSP